MYNNEEINFLDLVETGRVDRRVYSDPGIFEIELERIFNKAWIYVGHESQIPEVGDYITTRIGRRPMVMARHEDGKIYVIHNQCAHRGAMVVNLDNGNAEEFVCCYHGWTYRTNGTLARVPLENGYPEHFNKDAVGTGMVQAKRVDSYRGFVFASLAPSGLGSTTA